MEDSNKNLYIIDNFFVKEKLHLNTSLAVPSTVNAYSIGVQYAREWFLAKFPKDYFKYINIEGRNPFYDFRKLSKKEMLRVQKPALSINPQLQFDYNRDFVDSYPFGSEMFAKNCNYERSFFKDHGNNLYLGFVTEMMIIDFDFRVKVSTRAQQVDLYKFMQLNFRIGFTQGEYVSMDYHIPYGTMLQIANDAGFEIVNDRIKDISGFVKYLNLHSEIPIMYKLRTINGNDEFFMRVDGVYAHISTADQLTQDDGEKDGMLSTSSTVEMRCQLKFPVPKYYVYFSNTKHIIMEKRNKAEDMFGIYTVNSVEIPPTNKKGWNQLLTTEYFEEVKEERLSISFLDFFKDTDIGDIISYNNDIALSSSVCIDFLIINGGRFIDYEMDWETMLLRTKEPVKEDLSYIAIYVDTDYVNNFLINNENAMNNRVEREK